MSLLSQSEVKKLSAIERELSVVIAGDSLIKEIDKAYQRLSQKVRLKGFRPGKVPRHVLEQYYKVQVERDVLENVLDKSYKEAVTEHQLQVVSQPEVEPKGTFAPGIDFSYIAKVQVRPDVEVKKYKSLKIEVPMHTVSDDDIAAQLEQLQQQQAAIVPVTDRDTIIQGDLVECTYSTTVDGKHINELSGVGKTIEIGSGRFLPDVEQGLVGKTIKEKYVLKAGVPNDFAKEELRGKQASTTIQPLSIRARKKPELDNDFAKDVSDQFETLDALKNAIRESFEKQKEKADETSAQEAVATALIAANPIEIPPAMIDRQANFMVTNMLQGLPQKQAQALLDAQGKQLLNEAKPSAQRIVHATLLFEAIAKEEDLTITDQDISDEFDKEAQRLNVSPARIRARYQPEDIEQMKRRLSNERVVARVLELGKVTKVEKSIRS